MSLRDILLAVKDSVKDNYRYWRCTYSSGCTIEYPDAPEGDVAAKVRFTVLCQSYLLPLNKVQLDTLLRGEELVTTSTEEIPGLTAQWLRTSTLLYVPSSQASNRCKLYFTQSDKRLK